MINPDIRYLVIGDAEPVAQLITELGYPTTPEAMETRLESILTDSNYMTFVADVDGTVVGVAGAVLDRYYEKDGIYSRLAVLVVSSTAHGTGIGGQLVKAVERWSASKGAREVIVNSSLHRAEAHGFYERRGYSRTGYRFVKPLKVDG